ncbi:PREDICTED: uncharacterized protein LOC105966400 [Erythranthe guttata]|uniref:uncharacterized protein LOC105966400 n=1 Tax=Erythranthe guttata TaxID=4155 RepID=UPI00064D7437|nr:PREDICTED: uncharacterized protein LOC105966400 [Erythranthe guttata]|eukprot:XP_012846411.1 PREDICTED: uncharacterized protein LOC105966400 [Erythranthe guttata]
MYGFLDTYTNWVYHGETPVCIYEEDDDFLEDEGDDIDGMINDAFGLMEENDGLAYSEEINNIELDKETKAFFKLLQNAKQKLYHGCEFTLLSFILRLLRVKSTYRWSNKSFSVLLEILKVALPHTVAFPGSYREAWKIIKGFGLDYKKIHVCPNDCMLYWKETENETRCSKCQMPRYKVCDGEDESLKIPSKVVRYFPLIPRLQRLYMCTETSPLMRWHAEGRIDDGVQRHPADSLAWKTFDQQHSLFASDCRNVRLGLATDRFNPFKSMSVSHSTWPVILVPYNFPPGMCMCKSSIMLCLLIDGPTAPGNDIDIFLGPLMEELKEMWSPGVPTYDATIKQMFNMRAALIWTISDLPGYSNLSGWNVKTEYGCPCCCLDTHSKWLKYGRKYCFRGHRRFLDKNHKFRDDSISFDGNVEYGYKPTRAYGDDLISELNDVATVYGKRISLPLKKRKLDGTSRQHNWKKKSILFELPYWKDNLIRHNLDIMHIEKNVCDNIMWTVLGIKGNSAKCYSISHKNKLFGS